jgi:hypothetical protein
LQSANGTHDKLMGKQMNVDVRTAVPVAQAFAKLDLDPPKRKQDRPPAKPLTRR